MVSSSPRHHMTTHTEGISTAITNLTTDLEWPNYNLKEACPGEPFTLLVDPSTNQKFSCLRVWLHQHTECLQRDLSTFQKLILKLAPFKTMGLTDMMILVLSALLSLKLYLLAVLLELAVFNCILFIDVFRRQRAARISKHNVQWSYWTTYDTGDVLVCFQY